MPCVKISGFIGNPSVARGNRNFENYFVNGRYVKSKLLARAIEDAYHGFMMQHRYPFTLLYLEIDGTQVDVNVHPTKMELRFSHQEELHHQLCLALQNALLERERIPEVPLEASEPDSHKRIPKPVQKERPPEPFETVRRNFASAAPQIPVKQPKHGVETPQAPIKQPERNAADQPPVIAETPAVYREGKRAESVSGRQMELFEHKLLSKEGQKNQRVIGQVFDTYWLVEYQNSLYIIDQHAAHEKVLYERMMKEYREKQILSQMLCPPTVISLSAREAELLERHLDEFRKLGYEIEAFGGKEYKICAVPSNLYRVQTDQLFTEILDQLDETGAQSSELVLERLASMSCKAAVKGNQNLSRQEAEQLIEELLGLENPYNCPHGRPTIVSMSRYEMDKKFKRIL